VTVRTSADIHFDEGDVSRRWRPADDKCDAHGVLKFGASGANVYFGTPGQIDKVVAELTALRAEMTGDDEYRLTAKGEAVADAEAEAAGEARCQKPASHGPHLAGAVVDCVIAAHHAPVITDSGRDCPELNPDGGWPCHRSGEHDGHRDSNGDTWTTAGLFVAAKAVSA
jgi:hypothetical protein